MLKTYFQLAKPGIIFGNALTAAGGFLLASQRPFNFWLFGAMLFGLSCIIGSACAFNNYIDRDIDKEMNRTRERALPKRLVTVQNALIFATVLGFIGLFILLEYTNTLTAVLSLFGFFAYVVIYGLSKYRSVHGTLIGSISGAIPPVVGYSAVTNNLDTGAYLLFLIVALWQMPHFYAIAMYRAEEYAKASIPVLPLVKGIYTTKIHILFYTILFSITNLMLTYAGYTGKAYLVVMGLLSSGWLWICIKGFSTDDNTTWAKNVFRFSLLIIVAFSAMISIDKVI